MTNMERNTGSTAGQTVDVVSLIREQHQQVRQLMQSITTGPSSGRTEDFQTLVRLLAVHETAEEMTVYPALRKMGDEGKRVADARAEEENQAKKVLAHLESLDASSDEFEQAFLSFRSDVEHHAESEEAEVLPLLMESDMNGRNEMGKAFALAEKMAPTHAHRMAPESMAGNLLVGPFVGMIDKVRDAIRDASHRNDR
jgi:hemerythrin superfamily protein